MALEVETGTDWTKREVQLVVADYFDMLRSELVGEPFVKSHRNAALRELIGRSKGSIEFKHRNISAVLNELGEPWITGYRPAVNYQKVLCDEIEQVLDARPAWFRADRLPLPRGVADNSALFVEPPPLMSTKDHDKPEIIKRLVRKFDPAGRDARNRDLGKQGEEMVFLFERSRLNANGRSDLANKVDWVSQSQGDGAGYDILSFARDGTERLLEVKTTPFFLSENERSLSDERPDAFRLFRLYDVHKQPRAFELTPPLTQFVTLQATNYRASF
jgi:hypothetical protein